MENNNLIEKYNQSNVLLVISSYPERGITYSGKVCAVGGYAKNTLDSIKKHYKKHGKNKKFIVLTTTTSGQEVYEENGILVIRCFARNKVSSYADLLRNILQFNKPKQILIEFEFASFGDIFITGLLPILFLALRLSGKKIILVLHQVIENISEISGHIGVEKKSLKLKLLNNFLRFYYKILTLFSNKIIVLEEAFKYRLKNLTNLGKVEVISHGVDANFKSLVKYKSKRKLGYKQEDFVVLYFGYLTWYKGIDWLIEQARGQDWKLLVAGGESFTQKDKLHYRRFMNKVYSLKQGMDNVKITGFVQEKDISLYFSAADVVVLPYRSMLSSSGPLSLAFSFEKPVLLSKKMILYFRARDFVEALSKAGLRREDVLFPLEKKAFARKLDFVKKEKNRKKLAVFSMHVKQAREWNKQGESYSKLLEENYPDSLSFGMIIEDILNMFRQRLFVLAKKFS